MHSNLFSIRKLRETGYIEYTYAIDFDLPNLPIGFISPPQSPARVNYDIPTYLRRGIKLSEPPKS